MFRILETLQGFRFVFGVVGVYGEGVEGGGGGGGGGEGRGGGAKRLK